jgi:hypothetical protein
MVLSPNHTDATAESAGGASRVSVHAGVCDHVAAVCADTELDQRTSATKLPFSPQGFFQLTGELAAPYPTNKELLLRLREECMLELMWARQAVRSRREVRSPFP